MFCLFFETSIMCNSKELVCVTIVVHFRKSFVRKAVVDYNGSSTLAQAKAENKDLDTVMHIVNFIVWPCRMNNIKPSLRIASLFVDQKE